MAVVTFPFQKRTAASRNPQFYKDIVDAALDMINYDHNEGLRASMREKQINYDLANNKLDERDVERVINPWKLTGVDFPNEVRNYPLLKPKIDLLSGEERKRRFSWRVMLRNPDAVNEKNDMIKDEYFSVMTELIQGKQQDEEKIKQRLEGLNKWKLFDARDFREKMGTEVLTLLYDELNLKEQFNAGFEDALIGAEEIYFVGIVAGEPVVRKENPRCVHTLRSGSSPYIEDSDVIVVVSYKPLGQIIDDYNDKLTDAQVDVLEKGSKMASSPLQGIRDAYTLPENYHAEAYNESIIIMPSMQAVEAFSGGYDEYGNVREVRVYNRGLRKIGELTWVDEDGPQSDFVDENYVVNESLGQKVKWRWINEWLQTSKLGEDTYIGGEPFPRVGVNMTNPSKCQSPFIGTLYNISGNTAMSLMSYGKSYQYLYNMIMHNTENAVIKSRGVVPKLPLHLVPDEWTIEEWIYYFNVVGFAVEDGFKEGQKGVAEGKLSGQMNSSGHVVDLNNSAYIAQNIQMLNMIKGNLDELTGVSPQRQGQVENRETVGGVERAVTQSSHITEKWNAIHDNTKLRVMAALLEVTRYAWRTKKFKREKVLSDMSSVVMDFDGELFASAEYGLVISNASNDMETFAALKRLAETALNANKIKFSDIMSIYMDEDTMGVRKKIEASEVQAQEQAAQSGQQQQAQFDAQLKQNQANFEATNELKFQIAELAATVQLAIHDSKMDATPEPAEPAEDLSRDEMNMKDRHHAEDTQLERDKLTAQERMADKANEVAKIKAKPKAA